MKKISFILFALIITACANQTSAPANDVTVTSEVTATATLTLTLTPTATMTLTPTPASETPEMFVGLPAKPEDVKVFPCDAIIESPEVGGDWTKIARWTNKHALENVLPWPKGAPTATDINIKTFTGNLQALTFIASKHVEKASDLELQYSVIGCNTKDSKFLPPEFKKLTDRVYFITTVIPAADGGNLAFTSIMSGQAFKEFFDKYITSSRGENPKTNLLPVYNVGNAHKESWDDDFTIDLGDIPVATTVKVPKGDGMEEIPFSGRMGDLMAEVEDVIATPYNKNGKYHVELSVIGSKQMKEYIDEAFTPVGLFIDALAFNDDGKNK